MTLSTLVLALASLLHRGNPCPEVVVAIADGCAAEAAAHPVDPEACVALVTTYAAKESGYLVMPHAWSWDARAAVSCGLLQLPCRLSQSPAHDVRVWLSMLRQGTLAGLDSSPTRAAHRAALAQRLLIAVQLGVAERQP